MKLDKNQERKWSMSWFSRLVSTIAICCGIVFLFFVEKKKDQLEIYIERIYSLSNYF